jgi:hypothetical protein
MNKHIFLCEMLRTVRSIFDVKNSGFETKGGGQSVAGAKLKLDALPSQICSVVFEVPQKPNAPELL